MGEVYRGRDTRLGRDVALKVISPARVGDASLRRRFELEARAASVLNHPSIVTIYDIGDTEGVSWIAMEWVEGRTLREAMIDGPLAVATTLSIARQIAEGLATAHSKGIVHRDLKPENVMLTTDGRTKILDFGLARQTIADSLEGAGSKIDTLAALPNEPTFEGSILGTVGYMSPEQASGHAVGFHSDQFSFGVIVYEMLAGQRAFVRPTAVQTLSAIIAEEPAPIGSIRGDVSVALQNLIARCLAKRPEDRFASTREIVVALEYLGTGASASAVSVAPPAAPAPRPLEPETRPKPGRRTLLIASVAGAVALALAAFAILRFVGGKGPTDSLAILPFVSAGGETDGELLGDGLTEGLIEQMSRLPSLKVMARATVFRMRGADAQEAGKKLGVAAVLTGDVARRGNDLSISAELVETRTGRRLWGEKFEHPLDELIRVQDSIASAVAKGLGLELSEEERRALNLHGTQNPEAYELALKARHFFGKDTEEANSEARRLYEQAVAKDPRFAEAHIGLASTYATIAVMGYGLPSEAWARQKEEIDKAFAVDPGNVLLRAARAHRRFYFDWNWSGCEAEYRDLATDARLFRTQVWFPIALYYWARGRTEDAITLAERALRIDPGNVGAKLMHASLLIHAGRFDEAVSEYRSIADADRSSPEPLYGVAEALRRKGDLGSAIGALRRAYELSGEEEGVRLLATASTAKDYENAEAGVARGRLETVEELSADRYVSPFDVARLQAQAGDRENAFANLEKALGERSPGLVFLKVDRAWDRIRDDPRFAGLVRRVGIP